MFHRSPGFTLLEVLVGLIISAGIAVLALNQLSMESDLWSRSRQNSYDNERKVLLLSICRLIESAISLQMNESSGSNENSFHGNDHSISFAAISDGRVQPGGIILFTMQSNDGSSTVSSFVLGTSPQSRTEVTFEDLDMLFRYYDRNTQKLDISGSTTWIDRDFIPGVVELNIQWTGGSEKLLCRLQHG